MMANSGLKYNIVIEKHYTNNNNHSQYDDKNNSGNKIITALVTFQRGDSILYLSAISLLRICAYLPRIPVKTI